MRDKQPCGCAHDGAKWLTLCASHLAEETALHNQAQIDYVRTDRRRESSPGDWLEPIIPDLRHSIPDQIAPS